MTTIQSDTINACRIAGWHGRIGDLRTFALTSRDSRQLCRAYVDGARLRRAGHPCGCEECAMMAPELVVTTTETP